MGSARLWWKMKMDASHLSLDNDAAVLMEYPVWTEFFLWPLEKLNLFDLLRWYLFLAPLSICIYNGHLCVDTCNRIETVGQNFNVCFTRGCQLIMVLQSSAWWVERASKWQRSVDTIVVNCIIKREHCHTSLKKCTGTKTWHVISSQGVRF